MDIASRFDLKGKVFVITGGAGLLGQKHAEAVLEGNGIPALLDISREGLDAAVCRLKTKYGSETQCAGIVADITSQEDLGRARDSILKQYGHIDGLINNAANNPKVEGGAKNMKAVQFENFPLEMWLGDIAVGLTGAFLCAQIFGGEMAKQKSGVILNISSDLGIIAPDQRIYRKEGLPDEEQTIKPVTYSVIKHGLIGLTKYLATYYAKQGIRSNALCPGGVYNGQNEEFLDKLTALIPMGRMADADEYKGAVLYLISDASSYMTGSAMIADGGRTCW